MMVTICTRLSRFEAITRIAEMDDRLYCSVGIHPHQVAEEEAAVIPSAIIPERIVLPDNGERPETPSADASREPASEARDGKSEDAPTKRRGLRYRARNRRHTQPE